MATEPEQRIKARYVRPDDWIWDPYVPDVRLRVRNVRATADAVELMVVQERSIGGADFHRLMLMPGDEVTVLDADARPTIDVDRGPGPWIIQTTFRGTGDVGYWGRARFAASPLEETVVPTRGAALRYDDWATAWIRADRIKSWGWIDDFTIEKLEPPKIHKGHEGSSGRA